jgi:signal transduction histidine kinase
VAEGSEAVASEPEVPFSYIFASELHGRLLWFARLRWVAVAVLALTSIVGPRFGWTGVWPSLAIIAGFVAAYNLVSLARLGRILIWDRHYRVLRAVAIQLMLADLGSLLVVVHFTGGCHSPALPFVVFHMAIGTIMISTRVMYLLAAATSAGAMLLFALEGGGVIAGEVSDTASGELGSSCLMSAAVLVVLVFGMVYLTDTVTSRFKHRGIQLHATSEKLRLRKEELKQLLREREESERRKSHYMRISAHQLRSPLGTIKTSLQVLVDGIVDPAGDSGRRLIAGASERVDDLLAIVNDLLELAKMREGRARAPWARQVYINQVLADIFDAIGSYAQEREVELVADIDGVALLQWGVPPDLVYVFENLIQNAIKYSGEGGEVRVKLRVEDRVARIEVSDRGIGIPPQLLDDVFLEFVRAPNAKKHDSSGTGLGLSIVREGVEMHGGSVTVASEPGEGTTFTVLLPLDNVPPEVAGRGSAV